MNRRALLAVPTALLVAFLLSARPTLQAADEPLGLARIDDDRFSIVELRARPRDVAFIERGTFLMGSTGDEVHAAFLGCRAEPRGARCQPDAFGDEQPTRDVRLSPFWLQVTEVTVAAYSRCVDARRCRPPPYYRGAERFLRDDYPVSLVSWQDARDYCAFWGGRLPTEAEFERAARGTMRRTYPWGNLYNDHVSNHGQHATLRNSDLDGYPELAPVGSFPDGVSQEGIFDLSGNVAEWVWDRYAPEYDARDLEDPRGPTTSAASNQRVVRGGSFTSAAFELRAAARRGLPPGTRRPSLGFRCARSAANH